MRRWQKENRSGVRLKFLQSPFQNELLFPSSVEVQTAACRLETKKKIWFYQYPAQHTATRGRQSSTQEDLGGGLEHSGCQELCKKPHSFSKKENIHSYTFTRQRCKTLSVHRKQRDSFQRNHKAELHFWGWFNVPNEPTVILRKLWSWRQQPAWTFSHIISLLMTKKLCSPELIAEIFCSFFSPGLRNVEAFKTNTDNQKGC